jgi:hypothetical protein
MYFLDVKVMWISLQSRPVKEKKSYLVIPILDEDKFGGV